jgi:murein DD-endopeptidase MepM/ murein hydrolase activator NlpD
MRRGNHRQMRGTLIVACAVAACGGSVGEVEADGGASVDASGRCAAGLASAQFRAQETPPQTMLPGARARVSVTFDNCSGAPWRVGEFSLVPAPGTAGTFGVARVPLPHDVAEGDRVTVAFEIIAPQTRGVHRYAWAIARDGAETLQAYSTAGEVTVMDAADCSLPGPVARFRRQDPPPAFVGVGEPVRATVTFANCGATTWTRDGGFALARADGRAPWRTTRVELPTDVPFGAEVTVPVEGVAPAAPGRYPWSWVMQRQEERLGEPTPEVSVTALRRASCSEVSPPARFVAQTAPGTMDPGASADVDVTFANCGNDIWGAEHRINPSAPATEGRWGVGNIALPFSVGPGFQVTTAFRVRAPNDAGSYAYRWAVTRGRTELTEPTPERAVTVRLIDTAGPCLSTPVTGRVTDPYGYRVHPISGLWRLHTGIDFGAGYGAEIRACRGGVVVRASWYGGYGNATIIDHGGGMQTLYAHQSEFRVSVGQRVAPGQHIGDVGSTGNSTGAHLHFEVIINGQTVDPARGYL